MDLNQVIDNMKLALRAGTYMALICQELQESNWRQSSDRVDKRWPRVNLEVE